MFMGVVGTRVSGTVQGIGLLEEGTLGVLDEELGGLDPPFLGFHTACVLGRRVGEDGHPGLHCHHMPYPGPACQAVWGSCRCPSTFLFLLLRLCC